MRLKTDDVVINSRVLYGLKFKRQIYICDYIDTVWFSPCLQTRYLLKASFDMIVIYVIEKRKEKKKVFLKMLEQSLFEDW